MSVSERGERGFTIVSSQASFAGLVEDHESQSSQTESLGHPLLQQETRQAKTTAWRSWRSPLTENNVGERRRMRPEGPEMVTVCDQSPGRELCAMNSCILKATATTDLPSS